jgi:hypothetical protein
LTTAIYSEVVAGKKIRQFSINDQFGTTHHIKPTTKKIFFTFSKKSSYYLNNYLKKKDKNYLSKNHFLYVADFSAVPSILKFFVLPIKGYDFEILTLQDKQLAKEYKNQKFIKQIMVVTLNNFTITDIEYVDSLDK